MSNKETGGPAFPQYGFDTIAERFVAAGGMTLRDYFALNLTQDEIRDHTYKSLSREAQEILAGMKYPTEPAMTMSGGRPADYYIDILKFNARVNAAIRFIAADAMLEARKCS